MKKNQMIMDAIAFGREPANYSPLWILLNGLTVVRLLPIQSLGHQLFAADNPAALDNPYILTLPAVKRTGILGSTTGLKNLKKV